MSQGHLVLTRRVGESVIVTNGDDVMRVTVVRNTGGQVALMFDAAKHITVHREEIHQRIQEGTPQRKAYLRARKSYD